MIQVEVSNLFFTEMESSGVTLIEKNGERKIQIIVGDFEAQSIALGIENIKPPRPITHDLIISILDNTDIKAEKLVITELKNNTYYAELHIEKNGIQYKIDTRPSDGLAIAVRVDLPIFVEETVFSRLNQDETSSSKSKSVKKTDIKSMSLDELKKELDKSVEKEDYEKAAKIRDQINQLTKLQ